MEKIIITVAELQNLFAIAGINRFSVRELIEIIKYNAENRNSLSTGTKNVSEIIIQLTDLQKYQDKKVGLDDITPIYRDLRPNINFDVIIDTAEEEDLKFLDFPTLFLLALEYVDNKALLPLLMASVVWQGKDNLYIIPMLTVVDPELGIYKISFPIESPVRNDFWCLPA
jgi:hypothetical protein